MVGRSGFGTQGAWSWLVVVVGLWVCSSSTTNALPANLYLPLGLTYNLPPPAAAKGLTITDINNAAALSDIGAGRDSAYQRQAEEVAGVVRGVDAALQEYARRLVAGLGGGDMGAHGDHSTQEQQQQHQQQSDKFPTPSKRYLGIEIPDFIANSKSNLKQRMLAQGK